MIDESKRYEEQNQRNMVAMMEMQDTINHLQRELSALSKQPKPLSTEGGVTTAPVQVCMSFVQVLKKRSL